jgi:hypothetical protein
MQNFADLTVIPAPSCATTTVKGLLFDLTLDIFGHLAIAIHKQHVHSGVVTYTREL